MLDPGAGPLASPHPQGGVQAGGSTAAVAPTGEPSAGVVTAGCVSRMAPKEGHDYKVSGRATHLTFEGIL